MTHQRHVGVTLRSRALPSVEGCNGSQSKVIDGDGSWIVDNVETTTVAPSRPSWPSE